jgi:hypothetical protein
VIFLISGVILDHRTRASNTPQVEYAFSGATGYYGLLERPDSPPPGSFFLKRVLPTMFSVGRIVSMKRSLALLAGLALVLSTSAGLAEELPATPGTGLLQPSIPVTAQNRPPLLKRISWTDYSLYSGVIATHAADWATTEQCLRTSQEQVKAGLVGLCHEGLLPTALAESKVGLGAYEATTAGLEIYSQYLLTKHHHGRIARIAQLANIGATAYVVAHNYHTIQVAAHP